MRYLLLAVLLVACAQTRTAPNPKQWANGLPPIPDSIDTPLGPIPIVQDTGLKNEAGIRLMGGFVPAERLIFLDRAITNRVVAWTVLRHEQCHVTLWDAGLRNFFGSEAGSKIADAICDAFAAARVREMLAEARK